MQALVANDSAAERSVLAAHLSELGFEVEQAATGFEALAKIQTMPDLRVVLLGWTLPGMDGLEVLCRLRAEERYDGVPVVMVATEAESPLVGDAVDAGASEYLMKPFDAQTVLEKLLLVGVDPEVRRAA